MFQISKTVEFLKIGSLGAKLSMLKASGQNGVFKLAGSLTGYVVDSEVEL